MKKITMAETISLGDITLEINTNREKNQGCFVEILESINDQMQAMLSHHSRILVVLILPTFSGHPVKRVRLQR